MFRLYRVRLGDVISIKHGFAFPGDGFTEEPSFPTLVTPGNFAIGGGFKPAKPKTFQGSFPGEYVLAAGDLIVSMTDLSREGATLGLPALVPDDGTYLHNQRVGLVQVTDPDRVDRFFLHYFLRTTGYRAHILGTATGSTVRHTSPTKICSFAADLPDLVEQRAIAEVLAALDDKIAANTNLANSLAQLAESHFTALRWSTEFPISAISRLVDTQYGLTASACQGGGPRFLRVTDINKKPWVDWDGVPACEINESDWRKYRLVAGDILVARMADPGKAAFVDPGDPDAVFASYLVRLKAHDPTQALYIYYFLRSPEYWQYAEGAMTGSVQKNMNAKVIVATDIPMPNGTDLGPFNRTVGAFRASMRATLVESHRLAAMRDALLPQLMSGKIRVKDAEQMLGDVV